MASYLASLAHKVAVSADAVARAAAPVDDHGAAQPTAPIRGRLASVSMLIEKNAHDIRDMALNGRAFHLRDIPAYLDLVKNSNGVGIDDRKMLLEKILVLMSRLPEDSEFAQRLEVLVIDILYKDLPHPPAAYLPSSRPATRYPNISFSSHAITNRSADQLANANGHANGHANGDVNVSAPASGLPYQRPTSGYRRPYAARSTDGTGYSTVNKDMGAAGQPYARTVPPATPASAASLPDPGLVFDALLARRPTPPMMSLSEPSSSPYAEPGHSTLPPTDAKGFAQQPGGLSSLFFAFADLVIHSVFNTSHAEWGINLASSYLDLSPLYGSNEDQLNKVRRRDGTGRLWNDVFADGRLLFMPPNVPALLTLFNRNHNFIASKLLAINEGGIYTKSESDLEALSEGDRASQDDEIFARARLINCGWFMQVILGDYVGAILGLVRDGLSWRLDPLAEARELDHTVSPRGEGNVVSLEFNLLYRWHAAISQRDTEWTERKFEEIFQTKDFKSITIKDFQHTLAKRLRPDADVRKWTFHGADGKNLVRNAETGAFKDADLAAVLMNATEDHAGAFKARGIPEVMRIVEIMGIEQARQWGTCTINEFRKFMGLKPFNTFEDWNSDPVIARTAETLYGHIDNLELHVGLQAEEAKPPIPGAGLCPGYTISRAILADAVALVRGDRFLTTDFTVYNLTSWGYQDCFAEKNDGAYGGVLTKLLYRTLPSSYNPRSAYARFPFMVPKAMKGFLERLVDSPYKEYSFERPVPALPVFVAKEYSFVELILNRSTEFKGRSRKKLEALTGLSFQHPVFFTINEILLRTNVHGRYSTLLGHLTAKLIEEKPVSHQSQTHITRCLDLVRDVTTLVPLFFAATDLLGLPIKTDATPHGLYRPAELVSMCEDVCNYVFFNDDPYRDWVLRERALQTKRSITSSIKSHLDQLAVGTIGRIADSVMQWCTGEQRFHETFLGKLKSSNPSLNNTQLADAAFATIISTIPLYSLALTHIVDFYLSQEHHAGFESLNQAVLIETDIGDTLIYDFACEALKLNPVRHGSWYSSSRVSQLAGKPLAAGQQIYCSFVDANTSASTSEATLTGLDNIGLTSSAFFRATVPKVLRAILSVRGLRRAPGPHGSLKRVRKTTEGCPDFDYLDLKSRLTPFPPSLVVQFESGDDLYLANGDA